MRGKGSAEKGRGSGRGGGHLGVSERESGLWEVGWRGRGSGRGLKGKGTQSGTDFNGVQWADGSPSHPHLSGRLGEGD